MDDAISAWRFMATPSVIGGFHCDGGFPTGSCPEHYISVISLRARCPSLDATRAARASAVSSGSYRASRSFRLRNSGTGRTSSTNPLGKMLSTGLQEACSFRLFGVIPCTLRSFE